MIQVLTKNRPDSGVPRAEVVGGEGGGCKITCLQTVAVTSCDLG